MDFSMSSRQQEWLARVTSFMNTHVRPAVGIYNQQVAHGDRWKVIPVVEDLKVKAKERGALESIHAAVRA
jgi:acyl-CoA dehydrogenase